MSQGTGCGVDGVIHKIPEERSEDIYSEIVFGGGMKSRRRKKETNNNTTTVTTTTLAATTTTETASSSSRVLYTSGSYFPTLQRPVQLAAAAPPPSPPPAPPPTVSSPPPIPSTNKGYQMLLRMKGSWSPGTSLGKSSQGPKNPITISTQSNRKGLGTKKSPPPPLKVKRAVKKNLKKKVMSDEQIRQMLRTDLSYKDEEMMDNLSYRAHRK